MLKGSDVFLEPGLSLGIRFESGVESNNPNCRILSRGEDGRGGCGSKLTEHPPRVRRIHISFNLPQIIPVHEEEGRPLDIHPPQLASVPLEPHREQFCRTFS